MATPPAQNGWLRRWHLALGLVALVLSLGATYLRPAVLYALGAESRAHHDADMRDVKRMLACALWDVPTGCADSLRTEILRTGATH